MATYSKLKLSGSTDGLMTKVAATSTPGTTIHTAHATSLDEVWLWAQNNHTADRLLTIEWGDVTSPDCLVQLTIPFKSGLYAVIPGWILTNSKVVRAFAETANVVMIGGFVNRIA